MISPTQLTSQLYQSITADNQPRVMSHWHASSIAQCPRAQFYARTGIAPLTTPTGAKLLRWRAGHLIEEVIRPHLKKLYPDLLSNVRMTNHALDLTGEFDNYSPSARTIFEIKSVSSHAVKYQRVLDTRKHLKDSQQYLHHEFQQAAYVALMRHEDTKANYQEQVTAESTRRQWGESVGMGPIAQLSWQVEHIVYLYITLDGLLVPYATPVNDTLVSKVERRLELLRKNWTNQTLPECVCAEEDHPLYKGVLQYCDYKSPGVACCSPELFTS